MGTYLLMSFVFWYFGSCWELLKRMSTGEWNLQRKAIRMLHPILWNETISNNNIVIIFITIVESILIYLLETWTMNPHWYSQIQVGKDLNWLELT